MVIVSDNMSVDDTAAVVASFADPRLKYVNPGRRLGMAEHWEFAIGHVRPGFVTVLGDDDGLLPGAVSTARQLIARHRLKAVGWQKAEYHWPDYIVPELSNWLNIPLRKSTLMLNSSQMIQDVVAFRAAYWQLPCIYNSFISTDVIARFRRKNAGVFFAGSSPDVYSGFAVASEIDKYLFSERPLSISGASSKSNGTLQFRGEKNDPIVLSFWRDTRYAFELGIPQVAVMEFGIIDAFLKVQKVSSRLSKVTIDDGMLLRSAVGSMFGGVIPEESRPERLSALRNYAQSRGRLALFDELCTQAAKSPSVHGLPAPGYYPDQAIVFDAALLGAFDVCSVASRVGEVLNLVESQSDLFHRLVKTRRPEIAVALFARAKGEKLRLQLACGQSLLEGFVNVDYPGSQRAGMVVYPDVCCDMNLIDLPEDTVAEIRLLDVSEFLDRAIALASVIRWHEWLKVDGVLQIEIPDLEAAAREFLESKEFGMEMAEVQGYFQRAGAALGFHKVAVSIGQSSQERPTHRVVAMGYKVGHKSENLQIEAACSLLKVLMMGQDNQSTFQAWKAGLSRALNPGGQPICKMADASTMAEEIVQ
jgi:hypothetical protein